MPKGRSLQRIWRPPSKGQEKDAPKKERLSGLVVFPVSFGLRAELGTRPVPHWAPQAGQIPRPY